MDMVQVGIALAVGIVGGIVIRKIMLEQSLKNAKNSAEEIIKLSEREAVDIKKEAELKAKDTIFEAKSDAEREAKEKRKEVDNLERRLLQKEENVDRKYENLDKKEANLDTRFEVLEEKKKTLESKDHELTEVINEQRLVLEKVANYSAEEAKSQLIASLEDEAKLEAGKLIKRIEDEANEEAQDKARHIVTLALQRWSGDYVSERTVSVIDLPSDDLKGRIIGREGRNIRTFETVTGVDVIIDDTPGAVILSGHNPVRREIAGRTMAALVKDGRIHPARIEEVYKKCEEEVDKVIKEAGEKAVFDADLHGVHPEIQRLVGMLKFRTSYTQNVYDHSMEVGFLCGIMAAELGLNQKIAKRAGLLHDIGKAIDHDIEGSHAVIGGDFAKKHGERQDIYEGIGQHHDPIPENIYGVLVQAADTLSAARPGARSENLQNYIKRLDDLEKIAKDFKGVEKSYAFQAGREIRVIVENDKVTDENAMFLSKDIAKKIEKELAYPGQIKVTVVRETRAVEFAR